MRPASRLLHLCTLLLLLAACRRPGAPAPAGPALDPAAFDGARAFNQAEELVAISPRDAGTEGALRAARHIGQRLRAAGVPDVTFDTFTNITPRGATVFQNVIGRIPGTGPGLIIIGSHYDTKVGIPGFVGANDSASSSSVLLELGRVLATGARLGPTVELLFFDGEECFVSYGPNDGFQGSRHYAARLVAEKRDRGVLGVVVLDMIGDRDLTVTLPRNSTPGLLSDVLQAAHEDGSRNHFSLYGFYIGDDHEPFLNAGMPAVDIIDFLYGSAPGRNDYWHTPEDTMDKLSPDSLAIAGRVTLRVIQRLASRSSAPAEK